MALKRKKTPIALREMQESLLENEQEVWKPVKEYRGLSFMGTYTYEVSNLGRIRRSTATFGQPNEAGYMITKLGSDSLRRTVLIHKLVADAFLGPRPAGLQINHKDGDPGNNHISNLEYVTPSQNVAHAYQIGTHVPRYGEDSARWIISDEVRKQIVELYASGKFFYHELAKQFNISTGGVRYIIHSAQKRGLIQNLGKGWTRRTRNLCLKGGL